MLINISVSTLIITSVFAIENSISSTAHLESINPESM